MSYLSKEYMDYIKSPEWQAKRSERLKIDNYKCQRCGRPMDLDVHHLTYQNLGDENVYTDLITLCRNCHGDVERAKAIIYGVKSSSNWNNSKALAKEFCRTHEHLDFCEKGEFNLCDLSIIKSCLKEFYENKGAIFDPDNCSPAIVQRYFRNKRYEVILKLRDLGADNDFILSRYRFSKNMVNKPTEIIKRIIQEEI